MVAVLSEKPISALDTPDKPKTFATPQAARAAIRRIHDELARNLGVVAVGEGHGKADKASRRAASGHGRQRRTYQGRRGEQRGTCQSRYRGTSRMVDRDLQVHDPLRCQGRETRRRK